VISDQDLSHSLCFWLRLVGLHAVKFSALSASLKICFELLLLALKGLLFHTEQLYVNEELHIQCYFPLMVLEYSLILLSVSFRYALSLCPCTSLFNLKLLCKNN